MKDYGSPRLFAKSTGVVRLQPSFKHSKAEWVDISLSKNSDGIEMVVSDDGAGVDLDRILKNSTAGSLGLTSMRERA
jgi:signal transduction histidine kinase